MPAAPRVRPSPAPANGVTPGIHRAPSQAPASVVAASPPMAPSTVFAGLIYGASLRRPNVRPV